MPSTVSRASFSWLSVTNRIDRLEAKGLVERVRDSADRRSVRIRLTRHGKDLSDRVMAAHLRGCEDILSVLTPEEREQFTSGLRKVLEAQGDTALS
ncbi:MarR family winged helix-turn-helix transcriptional regulator [Streptomyces sp. NPDC007983]|uniref:MarR family winged helix-turn-helix transcriptional regulator n=1 Tax=Streptomyces sp. NPDC007983 TaxID=3364800 RepID=UPI0036EF37DF